MARVLTSGAEFNDIGNLDPGTSGGTTTIQSTVKRSGNYAYKLDSGSGNSQSYIIGVAGGSRITYTRAYMCFGGLPLISYANIMGQSSPTGNGIHLTSGGKLQLRVSDVQQGSNSVETVVADSSTFYMVEWFRQLDSLGNNFIAMEARLNGTTIATWTGTVAQTGQFPLIGWVDSPGANTVVYVDDIAINDDTGTNQNSWPGNGSVRLILPTADYAIGAWTAGAGGTTDLWEAVNNTPPVGVVSASETNTTNIENPGSGISVYMGNAPSFNSMGISGNDLAVWGAISPVTVNIGDVAASNQQAQRFITNGSGAITNLSLMIKKVGNPTDNLVIEVRDYTGQFNPPGNTVYGSTSIAGSSLSTTLSEVSTGLSTGTISGSPYYIVLSRSSGTNDAANYYSVGTNSETVAVINGNSNYYDYRGIYNSSTATWTIYPDFTGGSPQAIPNIEYWAAINGPTSVTPRIISAAQYIVVAGEDIATGSKLITTGTNGWLGGFRDASWDVYPISGAHGAYPTNWTIHRSAWNYNIHLNYDGVIRLAVERPGVDTRVACVCFMGLMVDIATTSTAHAVSGSITPTSAVGSAASLLYQYLRPSADTSNVGWKGEGGETTNLYAKLNETSANDSTYIRSSAPNDLIKLHLSNGLTPPVAAGYVLSVRYAGSNNNTNSSSFRVRILQGTTVIATRTYNTPLSTSVGQVDIALDSGEIAAITDFSNLYVDLAEL